MEGRKENRRQVGVKKAYILKKIELVQQHSRCLLDASSVDNIIDSLAEDITAGCADKNPVVLCVMTGAVVIAGLLLPRLNFPLELDYVHVTRYQNGTKGGDLSWIKSPSVSLLNREVIILDDVLDEGVTLKSIIGYCEKQGASACYSAVLIDKELQTKKPVTADFVGFTTGPEYLYGLGMDYKGYLRNVTGIYACPNNLEELLCQI